jgi:hypothetical protein
MRSRQNGEPLPEAISSRASGRPPEEADSEDPETQARTILEESDDRVREGRSKSGTADNSHVIAVMKLDNGELTEDVMARHEAEGDEPRIVDAAPMPDTAERSHPAQVLPGSLPRPPRD